MLDESIDLTFQPLTPERWPDLERLFGPRGAVGGCWCMWWRRTRAEFEAHKGEGNRAAFAALVEAGDPPGVLAYHGDTPIGWCAIAPRHEFPVLQRSRTLKPVDDTPVWSVTCFFVARAWRRTGISARLLGAAVEFARSKGVTVIEGYPVEPRTPHAPDIYVWTGFVSIFREAGFTEVARRTATRPIMRLVLD